MISTSFPFALISSWLFACAVLAELDIRTFPRAGVLLESQDNGAFVTSGASFQVPTVYPGPLGISNYTYNAAMVYVGIDVANESPCINPLSVGVSFILGVNGTVYQPWYLRESNMITNFDDIQISAGDIVEIGIIAPYQSPQSALMVVNNKRNGQRSSSVVNSTYGICGSSAGWFIAYVPNPRNDPGYPIANFSAVTFTDANTLGAGGVSYGPDYPKAVITDLANEGDVGERAVVTTTVNGTDTITFKYVYGSEGKGE